MSVTADERLSVKETAAAIRKALKAEWPGTKFSVRMSRGTGYGYLDATWTDGPTEHDVRVLTDRFTDMRFDGMDDSLKPVNRDTNTRYRCNGVSGQRGYSEEARQWAREQIARYPGFYEQPGDWITEGRNESAERRVLYQTDLSNGIYVDGKHRAEDHCSPNEF